MEDLNKVLSSTHEAEPSLAADPRPPQFVASNTQNPSESVTISIEPTDKTTSSFSQPDPRHAQFHNYPGLLYLIYAATLLYMFPSLIALVELKFQNNAHSAFETHSFFANMAVVAYIIAILLSVALFCLKAHLESSNMGSVSSIYYRILHSVFYFSSLLAPLSFVLVLFFPGGFDLIGYSLVLTLFLVVIACSFRNRIKLLCKKDALNSVGLQRNETSSHSALTITRG